MELHATQAQERLDVFLARHAPEHSRSYLQKLCEQGRVKVNGAVIRPSHRLQEGDLVTLTLPALHAEPVEIPILYQDDDVVVLNKPAGLLTHAKGVQSSEFTVADFMRPHTTDAPEGNRPGIVHRLDRETSGVIITATSTAAKNRLQKQFSERKVKKTYLALVHGTPAEQSAVINLPIERNPKKPQTFRVGAGGKPAETMYETVQRYQKYTLLRLHPKTGRTHQLRVHLRYIGCPIVGDTLYGSAEPELGRMFLHAASLEITVASKRLTFEAPLPPELQNFLNTLA